MATEHGRDRSNHYFEIHPERPSVNIIEIEVGHLGVLLRPAVHLPQASHAWQHGKSAVEACFVNLFKDPCWNGPWTNQAHLAEQHVEQLWQFVDAGTPQQRSNRCQTRIVIDFEHDAGGAVETL